MAEPCSKADKIERIELDIKTINEQLNKHSDKFDKSRDTEIVLERTVTILEEMREDNKDQKSFNKQLTETLSSIQLTMVETTGSMKELAKNQEQTNAKINDMSKEYDERFDDTNKKIADTATKITFVDGKGKIDVVESLATNWKSLLFGGGIITLIIALLEYLK